MAWTDRLGSRSCSEIDGWGHKTVAWTDKLGNKLNNYAAKQFGAEAFWPTTGDFPQELDKAARILRAFTSMYLLQESFSSPLVYNQY